MVPGGVLAGVLTSDHGTAYWSQQLGSWPWELVVEGADGL